ncbi:MAG: WbqC family protein [Candidatus Hydrogenedentes bacterium]|nr:WbqC family protein [Candidatus Hydrogenedentota bacterium]
MSSGRIAIQQPSYLPWLGFFDQMDYADAFYYFDDVQYTKRSWRSRNRIRCGDQILFLTVPVANAHAPLPFIKDMRILENGWRGKHLKSLTQEYRKAPHFGEVYPYVEELLRFETDNLCDLDIHVTTSLARWIGIDTPVFRTSEIAFDDIEDNPARIVDLCRRANATFLYNGQMAKTILDGPWFKSQGITIEYQVFEHPVYSQPAPGFVSHMCILDALCCVGPKDCLGLIRSGRREPETN